MCVCVCVVWCVCMWVVVSVCVVHMCSVPLWECFASVCGACRGLCLPLCVIGLLCGYESVRSGIWAYSDESVCVGELVRWWQSAVMPWNDLGLVLPQPSGWA